MKIKDRIKEFRRVPASELLPNPRNWRTHPTAQKNALRGVLAEVGIADACLARELPSGELELIDGHLRTETMADSLIPVLVLDVTASEADKILATLDPLASMAEADSEQLESLLREVQTGSEDLSAMLDALAVEAGIVDGEDKPVKLKQLETAKPPAMSWVLVGLPTVRFGEIAELVESLSEIDGVICETTVNDG